MAKSIKTIKFKIMRSEEIDNNYNICHKAIEAKFKAFGLLERALNNKEDKRMENGTSKS